MVIHPDNPINQSDIKKFERRHTGHTIITVDLNEIKGSYNLTKNNGEPKPIESVE